MSVAYQQNYNWSIGVKLAEQAEVNNSGVFHIHDHFEIFYLISGEVTYFVDECKYLLTPGSLLIINDLEIHMLHNHKQQPFTFFVAHFLPNVMQSFDDDALTLLDCFTKHNSALGHLHLRQLRHPVSEKFLALAETLFAASVQSEPFGGLLCRSLLVQLLIIINEVFSAEFRSCRHKIALEPQIYDSIKYIDENIGDELSLELVADRMSISKYYLSHLFKQVMGISLYKYILMKRVSYAKSLLHQGFSCGEVCGMTGFGDYSNFVRAFKRILGMTPNEFKRTV